MNDLVSDIELYDARLYAPAGKVEILQVATGFEFAEGPVWHRAGFLLFSDTPANCIYRLFPNGNKDVYLERSGFNGAEAKDLSDQLGSNGLALDKDYQLIICQHGNHALAIVDKHNRIAPLVNSFDSKPFNSPNDVIVHSSGAIFFSDPPYGLKGQVLNKEKFQPHAGLYRLQNLDLELINKDLAYPNGVCFSPGEEYLYVSSNHPEEPVIQRYPLSKEGVVGRPVVFMQQNADGMTTDHRGNLLLCTDEGILIASAEAERLALITLPETPSNICWGSEDRSFLFVTARSSVYRINGIHY